MRPAWRGPRPAAAPGPAPGRAGQHGAVGVGGELARGVLAAEHAHGVGGGAQERDAARLARLHKVHILAQEAVPWVHCAAPAHAGARGQLWRRAGAAATGARSGRPAQGLSPLRRRFLIWQAGTMPD
jgi:hypothetical protein